MKKNNKLDKKITLTGENLTIEDVVYSSLDPSIKISLSAESKKKINTSRKFVDGEDADCT